MLLSESDRNIAITTAKKPGEHRGYYNIQVQCNIYLIRFLVIYTAAAVMRPISFLRNKQ